MAPDGLCTPRGCWGGRRCRAHQSAAAALSTEAEASCCGSSSFKIIPILWYEVQAILGSLRVLIYIELTRL